jgi:acetyl esterase/lipase
VTLFGIDGLAPGTSPVTWTVAYGDHPAQVVDVHVPDGAARGVAVLVHGGYWRARYDRGLQGMLVDDLVAHGWVVANLDYRAVGEGLSGGGGWPRTYEDVAAAADTAADTLRDNGFGDRPVVVAGHSAGGALALWLAGRHRLPRGAPGGRPRLRPDAVVAQAGVCDLVTAARERYGAGAVLDLMGGAGPGDNPLAYATADPTALLPLGVPVLVVTGDADDAVPHTASLAFAAAAGAAGDDVTLHVEPGADHFAHLLPDTPVWRTTREWMQARLS